MLRTIELEIGHPTDEQMFLTPPNNHENFFKYPKFAHQLFNRMASMLSQPQHVKKNNDEDVQVEVTYLSCNLFI